MQRLSLTKLQTLEHPLSLSRLGEELTEDLNARTTIAVVMMPEALCTALTGASAHLP